MSPLGRAIFTLCDDKLTVNVNEVLVWFPNLTYGAVEHYLLRLGLSVRHA